MSAETSEWLNTMCLIGFTAKRGHAWHYRASDQGDEPNHYEGAIPQEDIERRLLDWEPVTGSFSTDVKINGDRKRITDPKRMVIVNPKTMKIIAGFSKGYRVHGYQEWCIENLKQLLDDSDLGIGSAILLRGGAQFCIQVELPDTIETNGVAYRPFLSAATSLDGSLSTTYFAGSQLVVCDNTMHAGIRTADAVVRFQHTSGSLNRIGEARDKLGLLYQEAEDFGKELDRMMNTPVSGKDWDAFLELHCELNDPKTGERKTGTAGTFAEKHADALNTLYTTDERCAPFAGTYFGAIQTVNTHEQHGKGVRGAHRYERNVSKMIYGELANADRTAAKQLDLVLAA